MIVKVYVDEDKYSLVVNEEELNFLFNAMFNIRCKECNEECKYYLPLSKKYEEKRKKCTEMLKFIETFKENQNKIKGEKDERK